ncbi:hypothetical protein AYK25_04205 [Thermoplasmatales archaeon SM1-50]|nr:MAG: hypothetical protein AYK25_04205 [Thermoplasmatales archaeon SM1-50]
MSKEQTKNKAGSSTIGLLERGEVVMQEKKTIQQGLVTSTMLPRSDPKSYWNTSAGKKRIAEMKHIMMNKGELVKA